MVCCAYGVYGSVGVEENGYSMSGSGMRFSEKSFFIVSMDIVSFGPLTWTMKFFRECDSSQ